MNSSLMGRWDSPRGEEAHRSRSSRSSWIPIMVGKCGSHAQEGWEGQDVCGLQGSQQGYTGRWFSIAWHRSINR